MSKFKIIEQGRILTQDELSEIEGGLCIDLSIYRLCQGGGNKTTCIGFAFCELEFSCSLLFRTCTATSKFTCTDDVYNGIIDDVIIIP